MPYSAYPSESDVRAVLSSVGATEPANLASIVAAIVRQFHSLTGYDPLLAEAAASTRTYDPPFDVKGYVLDLCGGFVTVDSVSIAGSELDSTEYDLLPLNASGDDRGWTEIRFGSHPGFEPASIEVTGRFGLYAQVPDDVYDAMLAEMSRRAVRSSPSQTLTASRIKQSGVELEFPVDKAGRLMTSAEVENEWRSVITRYRRIP